MRDAEIELRNVLAAEGPHAEARVLLGIVLARTARWNEADAELSEGLQALPARADALYWLAYVKRNRNDPGTAIELCRRALDLSPDNAILLNELALSCMAVDLPAACEALKKATKLEPSSATYRFHLGLTFRRMSLLYEARQALEDALRLDPNLTSASVELAGVLELLGASHEAVRALESAVARQPGNYQLANLLATAYSNDGNSEAAEKTFRRIMDAEPTMGNAFGFWLQQSGRFAESIACFEAALAARPVQGVAYYGLAEAKVFEVQGESIIDRATSLIETLSPSLDEKAYLCYALAAAHERAGHYQQAMGLFDEANATAYRMFNAARPYDRKVRKEATDALIAQYDRSELATVVEGSSTSIKPIFIVGMIRSGTTLLDQILSRHSRVESAGEPVYWLQEAESLRRQGVTRLSGAQCEDLAKRYLEKLESDAPEAERIVDKMPLNYARLGLIHSVFPQAKLIHLRRSPLDTCLSIYTTFFGQGPAFAYNQGNIVFNYLEYMRIMSHWREALPPQLLLEVDYEELVANPEGITRRVLEFCELPWQTACMESSASVSAIKTPSVWQARQPVYRSSVDRWRRFEPWLGALSELKLLRHEPTRTHNG